MTTLWIARFYFFVRESDLTTSLRNAVADALANNGSFQTRANELGMFVSNRRYSFTGSTPVLARGWNLAVKASMRDEIKTLIQVLPQSAYYIVSNSSDNSFGWSELELILTDSNITPVGTLNFSYAAAFADVNTRRINAGLQPLVEITT